MPALESFLNPGHLLLPTEGWYAGGLRVGHQDAKGTQYGHGCCGFWRSDRADDRDQLVAGEEARRSGGNHELMGEARRGQERARVRFAPTPRVAEDQAEPKAALQADCLLLSERIQLGYESWRRRSQESLKETLAGLAPPLVKGALGGGRRRLAERIEPFLIKTCGIDSIRR